MAQSTVVPLEKLNTLNKLFFNFLWNDKREKIKRNTLIGEKSKGGLEMCDVPSFFNSLKIKWITSLCNCKNANWTILPNYFLNIFGDNYLIFYMYIDNVKHLPLYESLPEFYKELIRVWVQINKNKITNNHDNFETVRKQIIWGNKNIKFNGKTLIFKNWIKNKILFVNDLVDENGVLNENNNVELAA